MSGWPTTTLGQHVDLATGPAFESRKFECQPIGVRLLRGDNIGYGTPRWGEKARWWPDPDESLARFEMRAGDVVVGMDGSQVGRKWALVREADLPSLLVQRVARLRARNGLIQEYLPFLIRWKHFSTYVDEVKTGSSIYHISGDQIRNFEFLIPPLDEQRAIASILGVLDDKIDLNRRMNETLEAMARAIFKSWFVDFDPVRAKAEGRQPFGMDAETAALFPDRLVESELGEIPEGWEVSKLATRFEVVMGQSPPGSTYNEVGEGVPFFQGKRDFGDRFPTRRVYCTAPTRFADPRWTLLSVRAPVGTVNQASERCAVGRGLAGIMHHDKLAELTYQTALSLESRFAVYDGEGTVFGCINKKQLLALPVISAGGEVERRFENVVRPLSNMIKINVDESKTLVDLRDLILPRLLSGEINLKDAEKAVEAVA